MSRGDFARQLFRIGVVLNVPIVGFGDEALAANEISSAARSALKCVYDLVKSDRSVQSVGAYEIDGFRFAIEYTFRDVDRRAVSDIVLFTASGSGAFEFWGTLLEEEWNGALQSRCHIEPAMDNLLPRPKPREQWRRIDLSR